MKKYIYSITRTDKYIFEIIAKDKESAEEKFNTVILEEAVRKVNIDIDTELEGIEEVEDEAITEE